MRPYFVLRTKWLSGKQKRNSQAPCNIVQPPRRGPERRICLDRQSTKKTCARYEYYCAYLLRTGVVNAVQGSVIIVAAVSSYEYPPYGVLVSHSSRRRWPYGVFAITIQYSYGQGISLTKTWIPLKDRRHVSAD